MKINEFDLSKYLKNGFGDIKAVLLFGTDEGGVVDHYGQITKSFRDSDENIEIIDIENDVLKSEPEKIYTEAISQSFFSEQKIIRLNEPPIGFEKTLEDLINQNGLSAFFIIRAGNLKKGTKFRNLCEKDPQIATLACYPDDAKSLRRIIDTFLKNHALQCSQDAMQFLLSHLGENRAQTRQELEKLAIYLGHEKTISYEIAKAVLTDGTSVEVSDIGYAITNKESGRLPFLFNRLYQEGQNPITLIRVTLSHIRQIYLMKKWQNTGMSAGAAAKKVIPYLFFKTEGIYITALNKWSEKKLLNAMKSLMRAEKRCKTESQTAKTITQMTCLGLSL
ncbi:MAG: DNA polymerase III subunit delta [Alphaproteobacteria bacterium]|nr:DNA polymerase III subunit delta [Alphaproteobacteria bacterium]MBN2780065.1 DNA polymerase III subunit delta [Alphaproteobacteria bacterium]